MDTTQLLVQLAGIVILGTVAQWLAWRFVLPSILLLLLFGFLVGPVFGLIDPDLLLGDLLFPIVSVSVAIILFEGGLTLRFSELSEIGRVVRNLVTVGALVTWVGSSIAAHLIFDQPWSIAVLLGAILVVSGPTVVMPLLRHVRPSRRVGSILKWEGIVIDPIGVLLALLVFEAIIAGNFQQATFSTALGLIGTVMIGTAVGIGSALLLIFLLMRYWVPDFLQNPVSLMMVIGAFALANLLQHESGLFAVTVMGIVLANQKTVDVKHILEFKENLRVLLISSIFIILAARLRIEEVLGYITWEFFFFLGILLFVLRPLTVAVSAYKSTLSWKERLFISWLAPRGIVAAAVSAIFALYLTERGITEAEELVPLTFLVIVGTVVFYGFTSGPLARLLKLAMPSAQGILIVGAHGWARAIARELQDNGLRVLLVDTNMANISAAKNAGLFASQGSVLSEYILDKIELEGLGRMLALTTNDEVNSLAALYFIERFGRAEVYQLPPSARASSSRGSLPKNLRGRPLFHPEATYDYFQARFEEGAEIRSVQITDSYSYDKFMADNANIAVPLFVVGPGNELDVYTENQVPQPTPGQTVIYLAEKEPEIAPAVSPAWESE